jgi:hypothetical protein
MEHGMLTLFIEVGYNRCIVQGFGGYCLYAPKTLKPIDKTGFFITRVLQVLKLESYEKLKGTYCRIKVENGLIVSIGNILTEDWFHASIEMKA